MGLGVNVIALCPLSAASRNNIDREFGECMIQAEIIIHTQMNNIEVAPLILVRGGLSEGVTKVTVPLHLVVDFFLCHTNVHRLKSAVSSV